MWNACQVRGLAIPISAPISSALVNFITCTSPKLKGFPGRQPGDFSTRISYSYSYRSLFAPHKSRGVAIHIIVTMYECGDCYKAFPAGWRARDQHCNMTGHCRPAFECDTCHADFGSEQDGGQHMSVMGHFCDHYDRSRYDDRCWVLALC